MENLQPFLNQLVIDHCVSPDDIQQMVPVFGDQKEDYATACQLMDVGYSVHKAIVKTVLDRIP
jgi:hypothetical protein